MRPLGAAPCCDCDDDKAFGRSQAEDEIEDTRLRNATLKSALDKLDLVNHPPHYTKHPSGVECIQITEHMSFCLGNALKYIWRADLKNGIEDLEKAVWYLRREITKRDNAECAMYHDAAKAQAE